jgi:hypothetical protein
MQTELGLLRVDLLIVGSRSRQTRDLRNELSSLARTLGSWVRIPLKAWVVGVCMRLFCV